MMSVSLPSLFPSSVGIAQGVRGFPLSPISSRSRCRMPRTRGSGGFGRVAGRDTTFQDFNCGAEGPGDRFPRESPRALRLAALNRRYGPRGNLGSLGHLL